MTKVGGRNAISTSSKEWKVTEPLVSDNSFEGSLYIEDGTIALEPVEKHD